eukprot:CAMPEP_0177601728 /NCGR_PEP_ID=MMETSP0419_2-20121207/14437_1 /TAXON_ID=582737 /ORGANISM="Tetraselmis sp., Strain GSL018" /LENGTH=48 /DNA_ID= /DNA_START= /DNA_END= /DNA_ORIENTATION=
MRAEGGRRAHEVAAGASASNGRTALSMPPPGHGRGGKAGGAPCAGPAL